MFFSPPLFYHFNSLIPDRREKRMGAILLLHYFLMIRGIQFLKASLIFTTRISNFFLFFLHDCLTNYDQQQTTVTNQQSTTTHSESQAPSIYLNTLTKFFRILNITQVQKLFNASKITPLVKHEVNPRQML